MRPVPRLRGFTMIEMLTVLAIVAVLAGITAAAVSKLKTRGSFSQASGDFIATLRATRAEAFARGDDTVVVVDTKGGNYWAIEDALGTFSLSTFNPAIPAPPNPDGGIGDRLIYSGTLPGTVSFGPPSGFGVALPPPYSGIPTGFLNLADGGSVSVSSDGGSALPNYDYCSFCDTATGMGSIIFLPSGGAIFNGGPLTIGQQLSMTDVSADGGLAPTGIIDFTVIATTGAADAVTIK